MLSDYLDGHAFLGDPDGLRASSEGCAERAIELGVDAVVGEVAAACSLVAGAVLCARERGYRLAGRSLRKCPKGYGTDDGLLTTSLREASRLLLVDDVVGVGNAAHRCATWLIERRFDVAGMVVVVDREEGAAERLARLGVPLTALLTAADLRDAVGPPPEVG